MGTMQLCAQNEIIRRILKLTGNGLELEIWWYWIWLDLTFNTRNAPFASADMISGGTILIVVSQSGIYTPDIEWSNTEQAITIWS